jgi:mitosis inhibitor protein kinase SWE1
VSARLCFCLCRWLTSCVKIYRGDAWHQLRQENFPPQVDLDNSPELLNLIKSMMQTDPALRVSLQVIRAHPVVSRARAAMEQTLADATMIGSTVFAASPLASVPKTFLEDILGHPPVPISDDGAMDLSL